MFINKIKSNIMIEKLREIEIGRTFENERDARLYGSVCVSIFKKDFKELNYDVVKGNAIILEGKDIGKFVDEYSITFRFREM